MLAVEIDGKRILWSENALRVLSQHRQMGSSTPEAGGILLGEVSDTSVLVSRVTTPSSRDKRSRFAFLRDRSTAQLIVDYEHTNSAGRATYLGEWHTHPEAVAAPSSVDIRMIRKQMECNDVPAGFLILAILGLKADYVGFLRDRKLSGTRVVLST